MSLWSVPPGGKDMTLKDEQEYNLIERNLVYDHTNKKWRTSYPWNQIMPNNRCIAVATLKSTETPSSRNKNHAQLYKRQIKDMIERNVVRKVSAEELRQYKGPKYYIAHHAVMKPESKTTPCRIGFNSSVKYQGYSLDDCYAKGPSLLNQLLGVLLRFRMERFAFVGDISKMFHSIETTVHDHMTHLFLWRDMESNKDPETYAITAVNMDDRPSTTIAQAALRKTAEIEKIKHSGASNIILKNSYTDDILGSVENKIKATEIMKNIDEILGKGGFKIKEWIASGDVNDQRCNVTIDQKEVKSITKTEEENVFHERVLGMKWDTENDALMFTFRNFGIQDGIGYEVPTDVTITKRQILSIGNSIYDPLGLITPFTVKAKIILRTLWAKSSKLDWDDPVPEELRKNWGEILKQINQIKNLSFHRSITPEDKIGSPSLVIFSDASNEAYGTVAYTRWKVPNGYECRLIATKCRIAPLKIHDIVRQELCGAVVSKRLRCYIEKELNIKFERIYHILDSEIVKAMINKSSYGFNTFAANRIGEIHQMNGIGYKGN